MLYFPNIFNQFRSRSGHYEGEGMDSEGEELASRLTIDSMQAGNGIAVTLMATRSDGSIYHEERSLLVAGASNYVTLTNTFPNIHELALRSTKGLDDGGIRCLFRRGDVKRKSSLPIELAIELWGNGDVGFTYLWGLAGQPYKVQLSARMQRLTHPPTPSREGA
jgi:hypothetical protein